MPRGRPVSGSVVKKCKNICNDFSPEGCYVEGVYIKSNNLHLCDLSIAVSQKQLKFEVKLLYITSRNSHMN